MSSGILKCPRITEPEAVVTNATRTAKSSQTLVDDVINNLLLDVLPRTLVSDHDGSLSRGIQFSRASLNGALTQLKNRDIKAR